MTVVGERDETGAQQRRRAEIKRARGIGAGKRLCACFPFRLGQRAQIAEGDRRRDLRLDRLPRYAGRVFGIAALQHVMAFEQQIDAPLQHGAI